MSIRRKLILIFIFMIQLPAVLLAVGVYIESKRIMLNGLERQSGWAITEGAQALENRVQELNSASVAIATNPDIQTALRQALVDHESAFPAGREQILQIMKQSLLSRNDIEGIFLVSLDGREIGFDYNRYNIDQAIVADDFELAEQARGAMVWLPFFPSNNTATCIRVVNDLAEQTPMGYLLMTVYADRLMDVFARSTFFHSGEVYLTDGRETPMGNVDGELFARAVASDDYLVIRQGIARTPWELVGVLPVSEYKRDIVVVRNWTIFYSLLLCGLGVGVAVFLSSGLTRPIARLMESISHAEREKVLRPIVWDSDDEIGRVIVAYNRMVGNLNRAEAELRRAYGEMEDRVEERTRALDQANRELQHAKEAAESASRTKSAFLAHMSHEIRTPLNGLIGMLQLMSETSLDSKQKEYVSRAHQSSKRLNRLLTDILDLSRVEAGKLEIASEPFDPSEAMDTVFQLFLPLAREKGLELIMNIPQEMPTGVIGDAVRFQQILNNLVSNAIKFTDKGTVCIDAHVLPVETMDRSRVLFSVSDTGIGISDQDLAKLFSPFSQIEGTFQRQFQGAGLGLAISKRLLELMDGTMAVDTTQGQGSTFYFCLPFQRNDAPATGSSPDETDTSVSGLRVLLAEDDVISRIFVQTQLAQNGHESQPAENGQEVLDLLQQQPFDLVLMDVQMPVLDGVEATRAIRRGQAGEENRDIPIVAMTAYAMAGDRETFLQAGMNGYLTKPLDVAELTRMLGKVLRDSGGK